MKKLFLSLIILTCTAAVATAQTPGAKAPIVKPHFVVNNATANSEKKRTDWVAYKQQIILDQQKKIKGKTASPKNAQTVN